MNHVNTYEPSPNSVWRHDLRSVFIMDAACSLRGTSGIWVKLTKDGLRKRVHGPRSEATGQAIYIYK